MSPKVFRVALIATGEELTQGRTHEANCLYMARPLARHGFEVVAHMTLGDHVEPLESALEYLSGRCEAIVVSGGLGPTADDLTRFALARVTGRPLVEHAPSVARLEAFFRSRGIEMPASNRIQAQFPEGAEVMPNPVGTAPGCVVRVGGCTVLSVPGVPREMRHMFDEQVLPRLLALLPERLHTLTRLINVFGLPESEVDQRLAGLIGEDRSPAVGLTVRDSIIQVSITGRGSDAARTEADVAGVEAEVRARLGEYAYGDGESTLAEVVVGLLERRAMTIAVAESCTGGLVAHMLTNVPGVSRFFLEGVVAYSNESKVKLLGVDRDVIVRHGAVSPEVAQAMAAGVRRSCGADIGVSTTGIAGPGGATATKPVGLVYVAWSVGERSGCRQLTLKGDREMVKDRAAKYALDELRRALL